jgi:hypothetical protein
MAMPSSSGHHIFQRPWLEAFGPPRFLRAVAVEDEAMV